MFIKNWISIFEYMEFLIFNNKYVNVLGMNFKNKKKIVDEKKF